MQCDNRNQRFFSFFKAFNQFTIHSSLAHNIHHIEWLCYIYISIWCFGIKRVGENEKQNDYKKQMNNKHIYLFVNIQKKWNYDYLSMWYGARSKQWQRIKLINRKLFGSQWNTIQIWTSNESCKEVGRKWHIFVSAYLRFSQRQENPTHIYISHVFSESKLTVSVTVSSVCSTKQCNKLRPASVN